MYAATRVYLKKFILQNFAFYNFSKYLGSQPLQEDRTNLELLEIIIETVTFLRENVVIVVFTKELILQFITFARILAFSR